MGINLGLNLGHVSSEKEEISGAGGENPSAIVI